MPIQSKKKKKTSPLGFRIPSSVRKALHIARTVSLYMPTKLDTFTSGATKVVALADSVVAIFEGRKDILLRLADERGLLMKTSDAFVTIYFHSGLRDDFEESRILDDSGSAPPSIEFLRAVHPNFGELYFIVGANLGMTQQYPQFYHSPGFDFAGMLRLLWTKHEGRIQSTMERGQSAVPYMPATLSARFTGFREIPNPLYGSMRATFERLVTRQRRFQTDGIPRSYMLYGLPGTGKSSFAQAFADHLGDRTLRIDASALATMSIGDVDFLLRALEPTFLLIDDIDKANMNSNVATLLSVLQRFKTDYPTLTVLITANAIERFDPGFFRPGRIDTWVEFSPPDEDERRTILAEYLRSLNVPISEDGMKRVVDAADGLTQDYIRELAYELRCDDVDHVLERIEQMHAILKKSGPATSTAGANGMHWPFPPF